MDWYTIVVGAVSFLAGMATTIMLAAMAAAGQDDRHMGQGAGERGGRGNKNKNGQEIIPDSRRQ